MTDKHVNVALTFRTEADQYDVMLAVFAALRGEVPYELTGMSFHAFDLNEPDE